MALKHTEQEWERKLSERFPNLEVLKLASRPKTTPSGRLSSTVKAKMFCPTHDHTWIDTPTKIMQTQHGCPKCAKSSVGLSISKGLLSVKELKLTLEENAPSLRIIKREECPSTSNQRYQFRLKCTFCKYTDSLSGARIKQLKGCPGCQPVKLIGGRSEICNNWLGELSKLYGIKIKGHNSKEHVISVAGKNMRVDGYHRGSNTVFEFLGDYWHGNPQSGFSTQRAASYDKTIKRLVALSRSCNVIYVWEADYKVKGLPLSGFLGNGVIPFLV